MMQKPFDVNTIMDNLDDTILQETHDATGSRPSSFSQKSGHDYRRDINGPVQRPADVTEAVPEAPAEDAINPSHYRRHPSGIECIEVTRHMNFNTGNAIKYIWRYLDKGDPIENLKKAQWYLDDEIRRLEGKR